MDSLEDLRAATASLEDATGYAVQGSPLALSPPLAPATSPVTSPPPAPLASSSPAPSPEPRPPARRSSRAWTPSEVLDVVALYMPTALLPQQNLGADSVG